MTDPHVTGSCVLDRIEISETRVVKMLENCIFRSVLKVQITVICDTVYRKQGNLIGQI